MQTRGALRSSPLPERAAGAELVLAVAVLLGGGGSRGESEREGFEGGKAQALPPGSPLCRLLSAGGYCMGTVAYCCTRVGHECRGWGRCPPPSPALRVAISGPLRAPLLSSLSLPRPSHAAWPVSTWGHLCCAPSRLVCGMGSLSLPVSLARTLVCVREGEENGNEAQRAVRLSVHRRTSFRKAAAA